MDSFPPCFALATHCSLGNNTISPPIRSSPFRSFGPTRRLTATDVTLPANSCSLLPRLIAIEGNTRGHPQPETTAAGRPSVVFLVGGQRNPSACWRLRYLSLVLLNSLSLFSLSCLLLPSRRPKDRKMNCMETIEDFYIEHKVKTRPLCPRLFQTTPPAFFPPLFLLFFFNSHHKDITKSFCRCLFFQSFFISLTFPPSLLHPPPSPSFSLPIYLLIW